MVLPQILVDFQSTSIRIPVISITSSQFLSASISCIQFLSFSISLTRSETTRSETTRSETQEFIDRRKVGEQHVKEMPILKANVVGRHPLYQKRMLDEKGGSASSTNNNGKGGSAPSAGQSTSQAKRRPQQKPKSKPKAKAPSHVAKAEAGLMEIDWATTALHDPPQANMGSTRIHTPFAGCVSLDDFAHACSFFTTSNLRFAQVSLLTTAAFYLPFVPWSHLLSFTAQVAGPIQAASSKRIHLKVASGQSTKALLCNNIIHCQTVSRPLLRWGASRRCLTYASSGTTRPLLTYVRRRP